ncbi:MAG TPA: D-arabinono-1,4-lactone oxidase [Dermatophilaceae bacterium]|nr:D-arabinono-1,4-lactone oxidase [Dermatophilaceae bacterium]
MTSTWSNWGRNVTATPADVEVPADAEAVAAVLVRAAEAGRKVRPVGSGHSFTPVGAALDVALRPDRLTGVVDADTVTGRVRVRAGTPLFALNRALDDLGLALPNLGDIDRQTVAGALATGTHGTGAGFQGIAAAVTGLTVALADGRLVRCDAGTEPDLFAAARISLGALGVLTEVELACVPAFRLRALERPEPLPDVLADLDGFATSADHAELYWFPHTEVALTKRNTRLPPGEEPPPDAAGGRPLPRWRGLLEDEVLSNGVFEVTNRITSLAPGTTPALNRLAASSPGERTFTDRSHRVFCSRRRVRFVESEYAVPRSAAADVLSELRSWFRRTGTAAAFPVEVRFLAGDDVWLSTAYGRDTAYVAVHQYHRGDMGAYLDAFESIVAEHDGRPHWGKLHRLGVAELRRLHPRLDDVRAVGDLLDPGRVLGSPYLTTVLGARAA